jgi:glutathione S-transferase
MHSGFRELRMNMPMSLFREAKGAGMTDGVADDIERIDGIWSTTRFRFGAGGPFLFGADFTAADAMYAPVVARFLTYAPRLSPGARDYCDAVRAHPLIESWYQAASVEPRDWFIEKMETALPG